MLCSILISPIDLFALVQFVEFCTFKRHVGDESLDIKNESCDGLFGHGSNCAFTGTHRDQRNVAVNPGFPILYSRGIFLMHRSN